MIFTQTLTRFGKKMLHYVILYHVDAKMTSTLLANAIFRTHLKTFSLIFVNHVLHCIYSILMQIYA